MQYIIIGAGFAGVKAIESIRENDKEGKILKNFLFSKIPSSFSCLYLRK